MDEIKFLISAKNYGLFQRAKRNVNPYVSSSMSNEEILQVFTKMLEIEIRDDCEDEKDWLEEAGWYDMDCGEPGSRFQNFLEDYEEE